jgi:hypothetical protein
VADFACNQKHNDARTENGCERRVLQFDQDCNALTGLAEERPAEDTGHNAARDRRQPEEPKLFDIGFAGEDRRTGAARGIDRGVGDRDRDEVNEGQGQADRKPGEARRRACRSCSQNDHQKKERQDGLDDGTGKEIVTTWAQIAIAVRGETAKNKTGVAFRHGLEYRSRGDHAGDLEHYIRNHMARGGPPPGP